MNPRWNSAAAALAALLAGAAPLPAQAPPPAQEQKTAEQVLPLVRQYCGSCHAVPPPDALPRRAWPETIRTMVQIAQHRNGRAGLSEAQMNDIIAFYYGSSPEELELLPPTEAVDAARAFTQRSLGAGTKLPFVTHVEVAALGRGAQPAVLVSDAGAKQLRLLTRSGRNWRETTVDGVELPVHTQVLDVDADGDADILVADLGQFPPLDAKVGKLLLLRQAAPGRFTKETLLEGLGRVSDARAADLDADGDLDIAVAVFGGGDVGELFWLENTGAAAGQYRKHPLLSLAGSVNVVPADLNGDGKLDLVTLVAQEHEMVVVFLNRGAGQFAQGTLARAPHPMYGSTSLTTVDLDRDGDLDVLFTNGDAFDAQTDPKPYHGVQWLENRGDLQFQYRAVGKFYGAATAAAGDLDGDGDIDVVAGSWINHWNDPGRFAIVWFENDGKQSFTARGLATRPAGIASLQLADVTGDGALDVVAGAVRMDLLLIGMGASYKASRLFPAVDEMEMLPRVLVLENPGRKSR